MPGTKNATHEEKKVREEEVKVKEEEVKVKAERKFALDLTDVKWLDDSAIIGSEKAKYSSPIQDPSIRKRATWVAKDVLSVHLTSGKAVESLLGILTEGKAQFDALKGQGKTLKIQGDFNINFIEEKEIAIEGKKVKVAFYGLDQVVEIFAKAGLRTKSISAPSYVTGKERGLIHINPQWLKVNTQDVAVKDLCFELEFDDDLLALTSERMTEYVAEVTKPLKTDLTDLQKKKVLVFPRDIATDHALVGTRGESGYQLTCNILESTVAKNDLYDPKNEDRVSAAANILGNFQTKLLARSLFSEDELANLFFDVEKTFDVIDFNTKTTYTSTKDGQVSGVGLRKRLEEGIKKKWTELGLYTKKGDGAHTSAQFTKVKEFAEKYYREVYSSPEFDAYNALLLPERQYNDKKIEEVIQSNVTGGNLVAEADAKWLEKKEAELTKAIEKAEDPKEKTKAKKELEAARKAGAGTREAYIVDYIDSPTKLINYLMSGAGKDPSCKETTSPAHFTLALNYQANGGFPEQPYRTTKAIDIAQAKHFFNMAKEKVGVEPIESVHLVECKIEKHTPMFYNLIKLIVDVSRVNPKSLSDIDFETILGLNQDKELLERPYCQSNASSSPEDKNVDDQVNAIAYQTRLSMMLDNESPANIEKGIKNAINAHNDLLTAAAVAKAQVEMAEAIARVKAEAEATEQLIISLMAQDKAAAAALQQPAARLHFAAPNVVEAQPAIQPVEAAANNMLHMSEEEAVNCAIRMSLQPGL
jgi:hypothetical protein